MARKSRLIRRTPAQPEPGVEALFVYSAKPEAREVYLAGEFNSWDPQAHRMDRTNGQFQKLLRLPPGVYEYKFVVDGEWRLDPDAAQVPNSCGTTNNVTRV